jgi:hypothetical protein
MSYQTSDAGRAPDAGQMVPAAGAVGPPPGRSLPGGGNPAPRGSPAPGGSNLAAGSYLAAGGRDVSVLFREHHAELVRLAVLLVGDRPRAAGWTAVRSCSASPPDSPTWPRR